MHYPEYHYQHFTLKGWLTKRLVVIPRLGGWGDGLVQIGCGSILMQGQKGGGLINMGNYSIKDVII